MLSLTLLCNNAAANRAVTIIDKAGVVRYHWVAESLGVEPDYAEIHARVAALLHEDPLRVAAWPALLGTLRSPPR